MNNVAIETSAGAVVFHHGDEIEYLLLFSNFWGFPKGHIEPGEDERTAALREIREEAGLRVTFLGEFRYVEKYEYQRGGKLNPKIAIYFLGESDTRDARLSSEHTDMAWLPFQDALDHLQFDGLRDTLRAADEFLLKRKA